MALVSASSKEVAMEVLGVGGGDRGGSGGDAQWDARACRFVELIVPELARHDPFS